MGKTTEEALRDMERLTGSTGSSTSKATTTQSGSVKKRDSWVSRFFVSVDTNEPVVKEVGQQAAMVLPPVIPSGSPKGLAEKPFAEIYLDMGVPASRCSVEDLKNILSNPALNSQPSTVKVLAANVALQAKGVSIDDTKENYQHRLMALNEYKQALGAKVDGIVNDNNLAIEQIEKEVEAYLSAQQQKITALQDEIKEASDAVVTLDGRISIEVQDMKATLEPFGVAANTARLSNHGKGSV